MEYLIGFCALLGISNLLTLFLYLKKKKEPQVQLTKDADHLLAELLNGGAVCTIQISNPSEMFQWSPRDVK